MTYDVCVVGAGASGSLASILLAKSGKSVCLIDKLDAPAKKILVTGNGRCNITNKNMDSCHFNQNIDEFLMRFDEKNAIELFKLFGLDIYADDEGRCYPISNMAKTVQFVLQNQLNKYGVKFFANTEVLNVEQLQSGYVCTCQKLEQATCKNNIKNAQTNQQSLQSTFDKTNNNCLKIGENLRKNSEILRANSKKPCKSDTNSNSGKSDETFDIASKCVIFACGINQFSKTICKKFGIKTTQTNPSLVALRTKQSTRDLSGQRLANVAVTATCKNSSKHGKNAVSSATQVGEILFKDCGLSGICIFNLSSIFARNGSFEGKICINLLKNYSKQQIVEMINQKIDIFAYATELLESMFSKALAQQILRRCEISGQAQTSNLTQRDISMIVDQISKFSFDVCGFYDNNQVVSGGVALSALDKNLKVPHQNIYFCGEICDVDGVCGGYNLQWAWTSAFVVSDAICKNPD